MKRIAVLALQGAFAEHEKALFKIGASCFEVRNSLDWGKDKDGLIIPGGESTVMINLLHKTGLYAPIRDSILGGMPVFGTCAGLILLAEKVVGEAIKGFSTMDITVRRNAYGRQLGSFHACKTVNGIGDNIPMTFIRAPYIEDVGEKAIPLAEIDGHIVAARQGNQLVTAFHPELDEDLRVHKYFLKML